MRAQSGPDVIRLSVVREMARLGQRFTVEGSVVRGPGTTAVAVREHPGENGGAGHVDLGFAFDVGRADGPVVWDCTAGLGRTEQERLESAVRMWATTTASAVVELQEGRGAHGDHFRPEQLPGWHAVQGPAAVFGFGSDRLAEWLADHRLLPALAGVLARELAEPAVTGVKLFLGGRAGEDVAEVRVNGSVSEQASAALRALDWPRGERLCWARLFVLLVPDGGLPGRSGAGDGPEESGAEGRPARDRAAAGAEAPTVSAPAARLGVLARWRRARAGR
ncbi:hypothetical protein BX265_4658 [Streptomyces sp. TLI_235]|nr:DUF6348 family protein [Streptomyces sp. TLI_235]PBC79834.1 hypothetical protein BX265_4658 [Streptomyces sp. TLI_235]